MTSQARAKSIQNPTSSVSKQKNRFACAQSHHSTATYDEREMSNKIFQWWGRDLQRTSKIADHSSIVDSRYKFACSWHPRNWKNNFSRTSAQVPRTKNTHAEAKRLPMRRAPSVLFTSKGRGGGSEADMCDQWVKGRRQMPAWRPSKRSFEEVC